MLVYIRVSKIGNRQDTLISDEIQEDVCSKWAEREGLTIVGEPITDLNKTGREMTKRQIKSSIERVRRGEADGIVVWKISRWGRNLVEDRGQIDVSAPSAEIDLTEEEALRGFWRAVAMAFYNLPQDLQDQAAREYPRERVTKRAS